MHPIHTGESFHGGFPLHVSMKEETNMADFETVTMEWRGNPSL